MIRAAAILGTGAMCVAPFFINTVPGKICAVVGLALLTIQALDLKAYNLVLLNLVGTAGYLYSLGG